MKSLCWVKQSSDLVLNQTWGMSLISFDGSFSGMVRVEDNLQRTPSCANTECVLCATS